jgi:hypothetical protein
MRPKSRAAALKHSHIHLSSTRDVRDWAKKTFNKELETDAALIAFCLLLFGSIFISLSRAFSNYQIIP